jgi:hypothetical protein
MVEEIWGMAIIASVSIISIIIAHFLILRRTRESFIFQTRAGFFQEGYKDNLTIMFCITQIEAGLKTADNVQKIQTIIDERPYNFPFGFLVN